MGKHWWYTVDSGMGIRCDKCDKYANMQYDDDFIEIEKIEDCPVNVEEEVL
ncbi:hypothetical protein [Bacillus cereus]|uniref:hypothetical protein n=1 Tax=Bacillus cereus TaxID=1396 RepID=UPI0015CEFB1D|nr:hypothetical protein [Bacillus cereus]